MRVEQSIECSSYEEALEWIEEHNDTSASVEYDGERVFVRHYESCSSQTSDVEEKWLADREKAEKRYVVYTLYGGKSYMYLKRGKGVTFNLSEASKTQLCMFSNEIKNYALNTTIDEIRHKYGYSAIMPASTIKDSRLNLEKIEL